MIWTSVKKELNHYSNLPKYFFLEIAYQKICGQIYCRYMMIDISISFLKHLDVVLVFGRHMEELTYRSKTEIGPARFVSLIRKENCNKI